MTEYWDLYNMDGSFAKVAPKGKVPPNMYHHSVQVIPMDGAGHLLVMRRSMQKRRRGGRYEFPTGAVLAGETSEQAAARELLEETGLAADNLIYVDSFQVEDIKRLHYIAIIPDLLSKNVILQEGETIGYQFVTVDQWLRMICDTSFDITLCRKYTDRIYDSIYQLSGKAPKECENIVTRDLQPCSLVAECRDDPQVELPMIEDPLDDILLAGGKWND
jgi:8-oxo-dGTP pyrophosphatase MutT (NUDIX family)